MNLQYKDEFDSCFSVSTASPWLEQNVQKSLSSYCIILNFGSDIEMEVDLSKVNLKYNSMSFLNPGSYVSSIKSGDDAHYFIQFNSAFYCLERHDKEISCNGLLLGALPYIPILECIEDEAHENKELLNIILKEFEHNDNTQGEMLRLLLKRLIITSVRIGREQLFIEKNPLLEDTDIIRMFQALVEKHFKEKHKVTDYADMMFKSPKTLSNTFKKLGSIGPLQIIQERVILEAKRQLHYTDKTVKEISYNLGFSEPAQFSRLFKNTTSISPSNFKLRTV